MLNRYLPAVLLSVGIASAAHAQEMSVSGSGSFVILEAKNTSLAVEDRIAVQGISKPSPNWGYGGYFDGGYIGVYSQATVSGGGSRYGGYFNASGGTSNYALLAAASGGTAYAGYFLGNVYISGTLTQASDARFKAGLQELSNGLAQLMKLKPVTYHYRSDSNPKLNLPRGEQLGLVAQDVAAVFPQVVHEAVAPALGDKQGREETFLSVDYLKLVPVLIKAVQEQQQQIEALKAEIAVLKKR